MVSKLFINSGVPFHLQPQKTSLAPHANSFFVMTKNLDMEAEMRVSNDLLGIGENHPVEENTLSAKIDASSSCEQRQVVADLRAFAMEAMDNGETKRAEEVLRHVLHLLSQTPSSPEIEIIETLAHVGKCCELSGRREEAMSCYREALQLKAHQRLQDEPQPMKLILASIFYSMGMIHSKVYMESSSASQGSRHELATKAIKSFTFSMELRKDCLGERHPMIASAQHNIAILLTKAGHFGKALEYYETSLASRRAALGGRHPEVAASLRHIAMAHRGMGNNKEAAKFLAQALDILKCIPFESSLREVMIELSHVKHALLEPKR